MTIKSNTFAEACYNQNNLSDLKNMVGSPDATDMREWNLTPSEWTDNVALAIAELERDLSDDS